MIGALLRYAWQGVRAQILDGLQAAGFADLRAPHLDVFQHPGPEGARPSDLAARARTTKQAMNQLLRSLEELGYVERRAPAARGGDGRARVVHLTARGARADAAIRATLVEIEAAWTARLGASRFADLKAMLQQMRSEAPTGAQAEAQRGEAE
ncbi:MAG TPA: MarR family transcriptional regulator [Gemmatimonadaceae bacterium]|nr:MarR family transcriptional regulator [Gemmatimonadaceae bacterium]